MATIDTCIWQASGVLEDDLSEQIFRAYYPEEMRTEAVPGLGHFTLTSLYKEGFIDGVVCLNYDGLLQKAGCPQEAVHEVHGSWFDPTNPALRPGGQVRPDIWQKCLGLLDRADLCVVIGTSLSGLDTDLIAETASRGCSLGLAWL